jgi:hypothetical protein
VLCVRSPGSGGKDSSYVFGASDGTNVTATSTALSSGAGLKSVSSTLMIPSASTGVATSTDVAGAAPAATTTGGSVKNTGVEVMLMSAVVAMVSTGLIFSVLM